MNNASPCNMVDDFIKKVVQIQKGLVDIYHDSTCEGPVLIVDEDTSFVQFNIKGHCGDPDHEFIVMSKSIVETSGDVNNFIRKITDGKFFDKVAKRIEIKNELRNKEVALRSLEINHDNIVSGETLRSIDVRIASIKEDKADLEKELADLDKTMI